jgi:hypothetical protein
MTKLQMHKVARVLIAITFGVCCYGLWLLLRMFEGICRARIHPWADAPQLTQFFMRGSWLLLCIPVPFLAFALWSCYRKEQEMEATIWLLALMAAGVAVLFFSVAVAIVLPWLPYR